MLECRSTLSTLVSLGSLSTTFGLKNNGTNLNNNIYHYMYKACHITMDY